MVFLTELVLFCFVLELIFYNKYSEGGKRKIKRKAS